MSCPVCCIQESLLRLHSDHGRCSENRNLHVDQIINVAYHQATFEALPFFHFAGLPLTVVVLIQVLVHNNYFVYDVENSYITN